MLSSQATLPGTPAPVAAAGAPPTPLPTAPGPQSLPGLPGQEPYCWVPLKTGRAISGLLRLGPLLPGPPPTRVRSGSGWGGGAWCSFSFLPSVPTALVPF